MRAVREGRIIVNVDVCINKQNVPYIDQIVDALPVGGRARVRSPARHPAGRGVREPRRALLRPGRAPAAPAEGLPPQPPSERRHLDESLPGRVPRGPGGPHPGPAQDARRGERPPLPGARAISTRACRSNAAQKERCQYCFIEPFCNTADRVDRAAEPGELGRLVDRRGRRSAVVAVREPDARRSALTAAAPLGVEVDDLTDLERLPVHPDIGIYVRSRSGSSRLRRSRRWCQSAARQRARGRRSSTSCSPGRRFLPASRSRSSSISAPRRGCWRTAIACRRTCAPCACTSRATSS